MGASESTQDDLPALPQQQILNVTDGQITGGSVATSGAGSRVGTSKQAVAVRQPITLARGGLQLSADGTISVDVSSSVDGVIEVLAPALEHTGTATWPSIVTEGLLWKRSIARGEQRTVSFNRPEEVLKAEDRQQSLQRNNEDGSRRWPLVLILRPIGSSGAAMEPTNGTAMFCCIVQNRALKVVRQVIAWGGSGHEIKELFGIQEAQQSASASGGADAEAGVAAEGENNKNCVVCLTAPKDTALMPCGHFCACYDCAAAMRLAPGRNRCPLCRQDIHDIMHMNVETQGLHEPVIDRAVEAEEVVEAANSTQGSAPAATPSEKKEVGSVASSHILSMEEVRNARLRALGLEQQQQPFSSASAETPSAPATLPEEDAIVAVDSSGLPPRCLQRLTREMRLIEEQRSQHLAAHGLQVTLSNPEGNDLRTWSLRIISSGVDAQCDLGKKLRAQCIEAIELEIWIPNGFPVQPPVVRVLRPCFNRGSFWVQDAGALCLEILTKHGWSPAMSLPQLGVHVKTMMSQANGTISGPGAMGNPGPAGREQALQASRRIESAHRDWNPLAGQ